MALSAVDVSVPDLAQARECAGAVWTSQEPCALQVRTLDLRDGAVLVGLPAEGLTLRARLTQSAGIDEMFTLEVRAPGSDMRVIEGRVHGACRDRVLFEAVLLADAADGVYELTVVELPDAALTVRLARTAAFGVTFEHDSCAITLAPEARTVTAEGTGSFAGGPPLLAVDAAGCVHAAWSVDGTRALVPVDPQTVELRPNALGGLVAALRPGGVVRDAVLLPRDDLFEGALVLTPTALHHYDRNGCELASPLVEGLDDAVALALDGGLIVVVQRGRGSPAGPTNVRVFRLDGTELAPPGAFAGRGCVPEPAEPGLCGQRGEVSASSSTRAA